MYIKGDNGNGRTFTARTNKRTTHIPRNSNHSNHNTRFVPQLKSQVFEQTNNYFGNSCQPPTNCTMAMRLTSAGSLKSSRKSNSSGFRAATKARHLLDDDSSCVSDNSYPGVQLHIPHMKQSPSSFQKYTDCRPKLKQEKHQSRQDDETNMLQFLNQQQRQDYARKDCRMPETWSVKLPAYHQSQPANLAPKTSRKHPPPSSMFRGNATKVLSPAAASSFSDSVVEEEHYYLQERREPVCTIHEKEDKKRWKPWFLG